MQAKDMVAADRGEAEQRFRALRSGRAVVLAMLAVLAAFLATGIFSELELQPIGERAVDIVADTTPSLDYLSAVETDLLRLGLRAEEYGDRSLPDLRQLRTDLATVQQAMSHEIASYRVLPAFFGETEYVDGIVADLARIDDTLNELDRAAGVRDLAKVDRLLHRELRPRLLRASQDIATLRALDVVNIDVQTREIDTARQHARRTFALLGGITVLVALVATLLVIRSLRSRARLAQERDRLLAARASELEAFAGRVAHDLRNPLSVIGLRVAAVQELRDLPAPVSDQASKLAHLVQRMNGIIEGLLEFAKSGANPPPGARADVNVVLENVFTEVRPAAEAVHAELDVAPFPPVRVACAPEALASVLTNLLGNAVKYVDRGTQLPHRISVRVAESSDVARIEIADNGPGLPPGGERRIFEPFQRLDNTRPGIGLGLATAKKIVEAYRGRLGVRSEPNRGSAFWFELPKAA